MQDPMVDMIRKAGADAQAGRDKQASGGKPEPIEQNQQAMQLIDQLKQMGYTADDVARAMGGAEQEDESQDAGAQATQAAPLNIPGT
jgi:Holliday junction resolvasome RuvABC DNA-binding subunit